MFRNADLFVGKIDVDYWFDANQESKANDERKHIFEQSKTGVRPYLENRRVRTFNDGEEILPGIWTILAPGHTAGHTMYRIESNEHAIVFFGDLVHSAEVQMPDPSVAIKLDSDEVKAIASRKEWLQQFARDNTLVAGAHVSFPGFGHVSQNASGFVWLPLP